MIRAAVNSMKWSLLTLTVSVCAGCPGGVADPKWPPPVSFDGTVTIDGDPAADVQVIFIPEASTKGPGGTGKTDDSGAYVLSSDNGKGEVVDGVVPGTYKVFFSKMVKPDGEVWVPDPNEASGPATFGAKETIPLKYSDPSRTKLMVEVKAEGGSKDFELKSK